MKYYIEEVINDIFTDFKRYIIPALIFSILAMLFTIACNDSRKQNIFKTFFINLKKSEFRFQLLFSLYSYFIADKTLLSRTIVWADPLSKLMSSWNILPINGKNVDIQGIENIIFFMPYMFLFLGAFPGFSEDVAIKTIIKAVCVSFLTSIFVETSQLITKMGTFQFSDLAYNTFGGLIGALLFMIMHKIIVIVKKWCS